MSEKLLLELFERVATLEERVKMLESKTETTHNYLEVKHLAETEALGTIWEVKGKYRYLSEYLLKSGKDVVLMTFAEIEEIIQEELPSSARQHRALWANSTSHSIAKGWMSVGYRSADVDMKKETVRFEKVRKAIDMNQNSFEYDMETLYYAIKEVDTPPSRYWQMLKNKGAYETAVYFIGEDDITDRFRSLKQKGRLDLTVEFLVATKWQSKFSEAQVQKCRQRLMDNGFKL